MSSHIIARSAKATTASSARASSRGARSQNYPPVKLFVNRIVNRCIQFMFWTRFNDLTNAFKAYRTAVIRDCGPYRACHFNLTLEMSLGALIREYHIAQIPIRWYGRTWGSSNLKMGEMGRRYLSTLLMMFFQRYLIADDLLADRLASNVSYHYQLQDLERRISTLEEQLDSACRKWNGQDSLDHMVPEATEHERTRL